MTDALTHTRHQLADLQQQRETAAQRVATLSAERERIAYDAATGDKAASKSLAALTQESVTVALNVANLAAAVTEAERRVAAAQVAEAREADRQRARHARKLLVELRQAGEEASAALNAFVAGLGRFQELADQIAGLGVNGPRAEIVRTNARRAAQTALYRVGLGQLLSPAERVELADLVESWSTRIEGSIAQMLGEEQEAA